VSDFFESPLRFQDEPEPTYDWEGPPEAVLGATVPVERVVARSEAAAVYLASLSAYPSGFTFDLFVVLAEADGELDPFHFEYEALGRRTGQIPPGKLRVGFVFADDSRVMNTGRYFGWYEEAGNPPDAPVMSSRGGGGDGHGTWHQAFWVWPLPPPGSLEFVCEWPAADISLTRTELDGSALVEAARRCQAVFPEH
jgi:hypothetical protein